MRQRLWLRRIHRHHDITRYARGDFSEVGKQTELFARFTTVAGIWRCRCGRDIRGFAVKFYTEEGLTSSATTRRSSFARSAQVS